MERTLVLRICLLVTVFMVVNLQGVVKAAGITQKGPGKPQYCTATAFSSTAVLLTWNSPTNDGNKNPRNVSIHYRPLYTTGKFTFVHAGKELHYLVENLDVVTYYAFRIVINDSSGNHKYCEVLAKTLRDARLSVPLRIQIIPGGRGLLVKWKSVAIQDVQPVYRLFMEWRHKGNIHVRLLYEGNKTSVVIRGKLPSPNRMYVSVVIKRHQFEHQPADIITHPTKQALIPATRFTPSKAAGNVGNKTLLLTVSIDAYGWNFATITWNNIEGGIRHVTYKITCKAGNDVIKEETSNTSLVLSGLDQLTRYQIKVEAQENNRTSLLSSAKVHVTTLDKDECTDMSHACLEHSECVNTRGSYFCRCLPGWTGDGKTCKEVPSKKTNLSYCESHNHVNITWLMTLQFQTALAPCPVGLRGVAKRSCLQSEGGSTEWGVPDLSECVSDKMANIVQQLKDPDADVTDIATQLADATAVDTHAQFPLMTGDLKLAVDVIEKISEKGLKNVHNYPPSLRDEKLRKIAQAVVTSSSNILDNNTLESWTFMPKDSMVAEASKLLKGVDAVALHVAKAAVSSDAILSEATNIVLSARSIKKVNLTDQRMPPGTTNSSSSVLIPGSALKLQQRGGDHSGTQYITFVSYRNLKALMQPSKDEKSSEPSKDGSDVGSIDSEVVSVSLYPMNINSFQEPVTLTLKNTQESDKEQASCVFWNITRSRGFWSGAGCHVTSKNASHTTCQCYHLTSFAVLMRVKDIHNNAVMERHLFALGIISYIGISVSVLALCLSFLTFAFLRFRNTRQRYFVHANLALSLGLAETLFLFGISKTANKIICKTIAITLHYLFLVSFSWMALEGVILYLMLVKIFRSKTRPGRDRAIFLVCGWGLPAIVVAGSAVLFHKGYGTKDFCWLSFERHFTWAFVGPVLLVCLFNFICLGKTFMIMSSRGSSKASDTTVEKIRYWSKGCALLSCLLGLTWTVGVFVVNEDTVFMAYLFNIFNTLQGLLIFLFHCIGDEKVRAEYLRLIRCQTRAMAYGTARRWWSKSDSISRSRASEKLRRSTLQSNVDLPKTTIDSSIQRRAALMTGPEHAALRRSMTRTMKVSRMYGIAEDDCQQTNDEMQIESRPTSQRTKSLIDSPNNIDSNETENVENLEEITANIAELVETGLSCTCERSSLSNLPDVIQQDCQDIDKNRRDSLV